MAFIQTIEVRTDDEATLRDHVAGWHAEQTGIAPGYRSARILADEDTPGRFLIEVDFSSRDEADRNNTRPETAAWAAKLNELTTGEPRFTNCRLVCTTDQ